MYTILLLGGLTLAGSFMSYWARKYGIQGLEIWLPIAIILSYAISPLVGLIVASLMIIISFFMFPYQLHYIVIMIACLAGLTFSTLMFPITSATFIKTAMTFTIIYNLASNLIMFMTGGDAQGIIKFALISTFFSWFLYIKAGWWMIHLFA